MSEQNTKCEPVTVGQSFCHFPNIDRDLMRVQDGIPLDLAVSQLGSILDAVRELAGDGVGQRGISERQAWLIEFCLDIANGLTNTIEASLMRAANS